MTELIVDDLVAGCRIVTRRANLVKMRMFYVVDITWLIFDVSILLRFTSVITSENNFMILLATLRTSSGWELKEHRVGDDQLLFEICFFQISWILAYHNKAAVVCHVRVPTHSWSNDKHSLMSPPRLSVQSRVKVGRVHASTNFVLVQYGECTRPFDHF